MQIQKMNNQPNKAPAFKAQLNIKAAENMLNSAQIQALSEKALGIGDPSDLINVKISEKFENFTKGRYLGEGDWENDTYVQKYNMPVVYSIKRELGCKDLSQSELRYERPETEKNLLKGKMPFDILDKWLDKLAVIFNPEKKAETVNKMKELTDKLTLFKSKLQENNQKISDAQKALQRATQEYHSTERDIARVEYESANLKDSLEI